MGGKEVSPPSMHGEANVSINDEGICFQNMVRPEGDMVEHEIRVGGPGDELNWNREYGLNRSSYSGLGARNVGLSPIGKESGLSNSLDNSLGVR